MAPNACIADGTPLAPVGDDLLLGQQIGAYRVARLLGIGGMGRVYKGVHPTIGSRVAIKVLSRECSDRRDLVERFFAEAKAVNLIRHESIVNVLDLATLPDGRPYIVMEYLDGSPLAGIVEAIPQRGPLPLGGIARLAAEVLEALGAAHAKGIIHRDLKPDNIYVTPQGRAKVLDFGIAKLQPELGGSATHTGSLLGTPHYMSPEQAAGRPVDARADLYAMGVILFECSTGHKPFTADSLFDLLRKHVEAPPPSPRAFRPDMPPELEQVIYTALAKAPEQRFASAQAMSAALQHATARLPQDQWAPIQPAQGQGSNSSWAPTPPASWSKNQGPTQTAGQVTTPRTRSGSSKGLWIGLAAVLVVGGGIAAAVLAGGGSGTSAGGGPGSGSATTVAEVPTERPPDVPADHPAHPAGPTTTPPPGKADEPDSDSDDDAETADALDSTLSQLPPEAVKMLPPKIQALLKKYGRWSKIPKAERAKVIKDLGGIGGVVDLDVSKQISGALGGGGGGNDTPAGVANGPANFNPKKATLDGPLTWAITEARKRAPDAQLTWISIDGVYPDGHADLTLKSMASDHGSIDIRFISLANAKRDPKVPRGVPQEMKCTFRVWLEPGGDAEFRDMSTSDCKEAPMPRPRCSLKQVWAKALAKRKDLADAVASVIYTTNIVSHKIVWMFEVRDSGDAGFSEQFPDNC